MIVPNSVRQWYEEVSPYVNAMRDRVRDVIAPYCREQRFLYEDRIKSLESIAEKIETGRFRSWDDLDDVFAATVVIPLVTVEMEVLEFLREKFEQVSIRSRGSSRKPPDVFRFDSTRFIGRLRRPPVSAASSSPSIFDHTFEVQVKTVFEFAWTRTTHALTYKGDTVSWVRQRLVAQLKAATEQMDMLIQGFDEVSAYASPGSWPGVDDRAKIEEFFKNKISDGSIPEELAPKDWTRFANNAYSLLLTFAGERPTNPGGRELGVLADLLKPLEREISRLGSKGMPRSISLLQFVAGVLGSCGREVPRQQNHYLLQSDELKSLYPNAKFPCKAFGTSAPGPWPQQDKSSVRGKARR
jgi:ppGpp synthetase/RelA/SpoT-type nucleotidyltranferase